MTKILFDTSMLVAIYDPLDPYHRRASEFIDKNIDDHFVPEVVLTEAAFLLKKAGGISASIRFLDHTVEIQTALVSLGLGDLARASRIMAAYRDSRLDFVDCCLMALSERLNITQICTFDRRDFSIFRPIHCDFLKLLP